MNGDGYGDGDGHGSGDGHGDGSGYGDGSGHGSGGSRIGGIGIGYSDYPFGGTAMTPHEWQES